MNSNLPFNNDANDDKQTNTYANKAPPKSLFVTYQYKFHQKQIGQLI